MGRRMNAVVGEAVVGAVSASTIERALESTAPVSEVLRIISETVDAVTCAIAKELERKLDADDDADRQMIIENMIRELT